MASPYKDAAATVNNVVPAVNGMATHVATANSLVCSAPCNALPMQSATLAQTSSNNHARGGFDVNLNTNTRPTNDTRAPSYATDIVSSVSAPNLNGNACHPRGRSFPHAPIDPLSQLSDAALKDVASIGIRLFGLPTNITTREMHKSLAKYGLTIVKIDISENHLGFKSGLVSVDIEPAPRRWPPWGGQHDICIIDREDSTSLDIKVLVQRINRSDQKILSPLKQHVPRQVCFECNGMLFGMMAREDAMFKLPQFPYKNVRLEFQFYRRFVQLTFEVDLGSRWGVKSYKIPIKFAHIKKVLRIQRTNKEHGCGVVIQLPSPPELLARMSIQDSHDDALSQWSDRDSWQRQLEITDKPHRAKLHPAQLIKNRKTVDIAQWTTYYLNMSASAMESLKKWGMRLEDYNVKIGGMDSFEIIAPGPSVWTLLNPVPDDPLSWFNTVSLPFEVRYQLEVCISQGLFNEYNVDNEFLSKLLIDNHGNPRGFDRARMMLEAVADLNIQYYRPVEILEDPKIVRYWPKVKLSSHTALVRRAVVTPTGIYFRTPGMELTNRVLRKYSHLTDRFLRVQFTDELTFGKIWSCQGGKQSDELYTRVLRVLLNGIVIGDRHYKILAWSNSQFREHGAFFFCSTDHVSCDDIREWMGDLKHIRSVGKFAARMGQCFTTTLQLHGVSVPRIVEIKDIERERDGRVWNFTDGVGKISPFFAQMIRTEQDLLHTPSCFQFRMGGCKGVLVVWNDVHASEVHIRPSQEKFKAPYNGLETINYSRFSHAMLNRQVIPILSSLGVEDHVFMSLLEEELQDYEDALTVSDRASALLRERVDENQTSLVLADMVDTFMEGQEPFMWTMLRLWKCWAFQRLKFKAAISVKKSAFLYGCVDELGVLRGHSKLTEGRGVQDKNSLPQIFLQVPKQGTGPNNTLNYEVITGICVVGRNPSLHPGDIRVVEAVDAPGLRHLKDVVVFPQSGDRDLPSMCSGGDLDGDDFFVFWDERLVPREWDYPAMNHDADSSASGAERERDVNINDMCAFFAQYMKNDCVGLVATAHFAWADKLGPKSGKCVELAKLHSMAVDYIKSGNPAIMHKSLIVKDSPHWMERKGKNYRSQKPVGRIYDRINVEEFNPAYDLPFDNRILSRFALSAEEFAKAKEIKGRYDIAMRRLMGQHERPVSEFEIWSTFILSKPRVGNVYKLQEQVGRDVSALKDSFRIQCGEAVTGTAQTTMIFSCSGIDLERLDRFVAAMYKVTHQEVQEALKARALPVLDEEGNKLADDQGPNFPMPLISFPWLFHMELARIARGGVPPATWQPKKPQESEKSPESNAKIASLMGNNSVQTQGVIGKEGVIGKKEGAKLVINGGTVFVDEDVVRTASGKVIHRGEQLELFSDKSEVIDGSDIGASQVPASAEEAAECLQVWSGLDEVERDETDDEGASEEQANDLAGASIEVEEVESDVEDDLEELANKLAGVGNEDSH